MIALRIFICFHILFSTISANETTLTFLTFNDVYRVEPLEGWGGMAEMMTLLKEERSHAKHSITTINGDFIGGSFLSSIFKGKQMIDMFNLLGVDLVNIGNHEFDFGPEELKMRIDESSFIWLNSNIFLKDEQLFYHTQEYLIKEYDGIKVGFLSLTLPETKSSSKPGPDVVFKPIIEAAQKTVNKLKKEGADVIVAITHLELTQDKMLVENIPEIDLVLGGHEHEIIAFEKEQTLIVKSGSDAKYLGRIDLTINTDNEHMHIIPKLSFIPNFKTPPETQVAERVKYYNNYLENKYSNPIATTKTLLDSRRDVVRSREAAIGNFFTDVMRNSLHSKVDAAIINGGGIRGNRIYQANTQLTAQDILTELPFKEKVILIELSGKILLDVIEHSVSKVEHGDGRFLQVSGLSFVWDESKSAGERVNTLLVDGNPIDLDKSYRIATIPFLYNGGDGFEMLKEAKLILAPNLANELTEQVINYLIKYEDISPVVEGRIIKK